MRNGKGDWLSEQAIPKLHACPSPQAGLRPPVVVIVDVVLDFGDDIVRRGVLLTVLFSVLVLKEKLRWKSWLGLGLLVAGTVCMAVFA